MRATEFNVPTLEAQDEKPVTIMLPPIALDQSHVQQLGADSFKSSWTLRSEARLDGR